MRTQEDGRASADTEDAAKRHRNRHYPEPSAFARSMPGSPHTVQSSSILHAEPAHSRSDFRLLSPLLRVGLSLGILTMATIVARWLVTTEHTGSALFTILAAAALIAILLPVGRRP